ncbi:DoxX family protein [Aequorivita sp. F47161]|uniref:DoxX family protein n=1 Tax=Aequorivita vitellina TaxID=2874475 RepID=A0A9X1U8K8_9FLAO|nr:DoxX family protein [Aequorivita vitellina]MCG2417546.1 DoxX family protein [Aequorivita vitellina]MCZ4318193.1 DoxX family protein [Aequorivita viscosa]
MSAQKTIYWIATGLLSVLFLYSAFTYLTDTAVIEGTYQDYQYPGYLVIPMAIAKIFAIVFIVLRKPKWVMEWAYAGLFFDLVLACFALYRIGDPGLTLPLLGILFLLLSYFFGKTVRP